MSGIAPPRARSRRDFLFGSTAIVVAGVNASDQATAQRVGDPALPMPTERAAMADAAAVFMHAYDVPGLGVAIAHRGRLAYDEAFGLADRQANAVLTIRHRFRIASVSKPITAVAIFTLVEQGALKLTDRPFGRTGILGGAFPSGADARVESITVEHLLTHTAGGWQNNGSDPMFQKPELDQKELIAWTLRTQPLQAQPGERYAYSNFGYCILGRVIEAVTRQPYEGFVQQAVLRKAGIDDMGLASNSLAERQPQEVRYHGQAGESPYKPNVRRMDAHGGWIARPAALAMLACHVNGLSQPRLLQPETIAVMTTASIANVGYAKGWSVNRSHNWWHNGSLPGTASIMVHTRGGLCWAALANTRRPHGNMNLDLDKLVWTMVKQVRGWT